jgi:hypothetical protein
MKSILALITMSLVINAQANSESYKILKCVDSNNAEPLFSVTVPQDISHQNSGNVEVQLSTGQKLSGNYQSRVIVEETRLKGYTTLQLEADYEFPDYSKPHTLQVAIIGNELNGSNKFFGSATLLSLTGHKIQEYIVNCEP